MLKLSKMDTKSKWFISYLLVLCVPIFMCIALWFYMQASINSERIIGGRMQIENVIQRVEAEAAVNVMAANYFKHSEAVKAADSLENLNSDAERQVVQKLSEVINEYKYQTGSRDTIFIYLKRIDTIVTSEGYYIPLSYWKKYYSDSGMSFAEWKTVISKSLNVKYNLYSLAFQDKNKAVYQSFLHTTIIQKKSDARYSVVAVQSAEPVNYSHNMGSAYFIIYDDAGELVYGSGNIQAEMLPVLLNSKTDEILKIGRQRYIINHEASEKLGFRFVVAVELYDIFTESVLPFVYMGLILVSSAACVWLLWKISKKNYTVIDRIVTRLRKFRDGVSSTNEVAMINYLIDKMIKENQDQEQLLLKQKDQFIEINVSRLLHGHVKVFESIQEGLVEDERLTFLSDYFAVAVIILEDYRNFFESDGREVMAEEVDLVRFAIKNVSEEVIGERGNKAYFADMEEIATLLVSFSPDGLETARDTLAESCKFIQSFLKQQLKIKTTIAISNICMGTDDIQSVYKQALEIAEYKYVLGEELIITPDDIDIQKDVRYGYTQEREGWLVNLIKSGDGPQAAALINDVLELEDEQKLQDIKRIQCMAYDIAATLVRLCGAVDMDEDVFNENDFLDALMNARNVEGMKKIILEATQQICGKYENNASYSLTKNVAGYIEEVYNDSSLSVSRIAEHFHFHPTYMSNIFKEKMGIGMLEYINKIRVNKSIELLLTTDYSINDISERIGYLNANTYIRIFKKIMGVTPNRYRSIKQ